MAQEFDVFSDQKGNNVPPDRRQLYYTRRDKNEYACVVENLPVCSCWGLLSRLAGHSNMLWSIVIGKSIQFVGCANLWSFLEWVLRLHPQSEPSEPKPGHHRSDHPTAEAMQKHIRLSPDADLAGQKRLSQESYESKRFAVWNSSPQTLAAGGTRPVFDSFILSLEGFFFVRSIHYWAVYPVDKRICFRVYLKTPQRCPILPKSASAALQSLAFHRGVRRSCALQLHLLGELFSIFEFSDTP